jgi:hypothetical protein
MQHYTSTEVRALLCDGCRHGLATRRNTDGTLAHMLAGRAVASCTAVAWMEAERREAGRRRMAAARKGGKA